MSNVTVGMITRTAIKTLRNHWSFLLVIGLLYAIVTVLISYTWWTPLVLSNPLTMGFFRTIHQISQGKDFEFTDFAWFFLDLNRFFKSVFLGILLILMVFWGFLLLIIPGFIVTLDHFWSVPLMAIDDTLSLQQSLKKSKQITKSVGRWFVTKLIFLMAIIGFLGTTLTLGIGLLFIFPLLMLMVLQALEKISLNIQSEQQNLIPVR